MTAPPIQPARITWLDDGTPFSPEYGDVFHAKVGAAEQARHVFLGGNGLPERWRDRTDFTVAETGFGLGGNFLATWQAWQDDPRRPARLHYVAIEAHPASPEDLLRAHAQAPWAALAADLVAAWPLPVPGVHAVSLQGGAVQLTLAFGDVQRVLPQLVFRADAFYLDGFAPDRNPDMWGPGVMKALGARAAPGATAATWCVARMLRDGLAAAGFACERTPGIGGKREVLRARHVPHPRATRPVPGVDERRAVVVGAGLAGAAVARALAVRGFDVQVFEAAPAAAAASSGNPAGLFHATVHADDGPYARLFRQAALHLQRELAAAPAGDIRGSRDGLLRLEKTLPLDAMQALLLRQDWPPALVRAVAPDEATALAGVPVPWPCWHYPGDGWLSPAHWVRRALDHPRCTLSTGRPVAALRRVGGQWQALGADGAPLGEAPALVLACADQVAPLLGGLGLQVPELRRSRGQVTWTDDPTLAPPLRLPLAGDGYAVPLPGGGLLCGATTTQDEGPEPSAVERRVNLDRLQRLTGLAVDLDGDGWQSRVGWRVNTVDRLPLAGPVAELRPGDPAPDRLVRVPRVQGLHLLAALGSRGVTLAPLLGDLVAARMAGTPWPLEQRLADAVDPARFAVRAARRAEARS